MKFQVLGMSLFCAATLAAALPVEPSTESAPQPCIPAELAKVLTCVPEDSPLFCKGDSQPEKRDGDEPPIEVCRDAQEAYDAGDEDEESVGDLLAACKAAYGPPGNEKRQAPPASLVEDALGKAKGVAGSVTHERTCVYSQVPRTPDSHHGGDLVIRLNQQGHLNTTSESQARYYSSSSWVVDVDGPNGSRPSAGCGIGPCVKSRDPSAPPTSQGGLEFPDGQAHLFVHLTEVDRLIHWYSNYCHLWYPIVDIPEVIISLENLRHNRSSPVGSLALIAAICFAAACSANASGDLKSLSPISTSSAWKDLAVQLLSSNRYPRQPNLNTVRAAFLLALPSVADGRTHPDPSPVCVLLRAAQSLGLHRDPSSFNLPPSEVDFRRVLWWCIHSLDVCYSVAHALPPLIHATATDVQTMEQNGMSERKLIGTIIRVNSLISTIFQTVYGIRQPTGKDIHDLDEKATKICTDEISTRTSLEMAAAEKFITMSQRMCCYKMLFILHQPYLRSTQWPQTSRQKALAACQNYINDYLLGIADPELAPYRWILGHFDVTHACAIVLQDMIQHPGSVESVGMRSLVETCFFTFSSDSHPDWAKWEVLGSKAWAANGWPCPFQQDWGSLDADASLSDWDPLFASFIWENMLL
ncbi:fungal-specific transcription factor domain-containing protein [Aspergillus minisclerotigenes]|uniref:Fungal-specific transcription factor domain-containing protein n=1 Tax=Aspergillus minisclerotigenes TaxID=656917 RepID=A0A5N6IM82_9EURO|nr:fungal-specific transcription factor domain-containing protein [Aspergillus minisclerotigenes]